ncbi:MAG: hypothetical protein AAF614_24925 [Chloroflexota bacterium]
MNLVAVTYLIYIVLSVSITVWVAQNLFRNGRLFLRDAFGGDDEMANAVNHLLLVGFYLVNIGFVAMYLRLGTKPVTTVEAIEYVSSKVGVVLLVLGGMHFFNMYNFSKIRSKGRKGNNSQEPNDVAATVETAVEGAAA